jgi:hypothetical protein
MNLQRREFPSFFRPAKPPEKRGLTMMNPQSDATWGELLHSVVYMPGKHLAAYTGFHNYSFVQ